MKYYFSKVIKDPYEKAIEKVISNLKYEGFGIVSEIKMHDKFKEKLSVEFKKYTILGACNPFFAYKALQKEDKIGAMLPCNILVIEQGKGKVEVAAINPMVSMQSVNNADLEQLAHAVSESLSRAVEKL
jgi:uncharacterized protein (DUF302 family)